MEEQPAKLILIRVEREQKLLHIEVDLEAQQIARSGVLLLLHLWSERTAETNNTITAGVRKHSADGESKALRATTAIRATQ
jgi:hypothetical protein